MAPTITFFISPAEDFRHTYARLRSYDPAGISERIRKKGINLAVANSFLTAQDREERNEIWKNYLNDFYEKHRNEMEDAKESLTETWAEIGNKFFQLTQRRMGDIPWRYSEYHFLVSSFFSSSVWGTGNKLTIWWKRGAEGSYHIVGQELILAHFFETIYGIYGKLPVSEKKVWVLAEIFAFLLVYRDEEIMKQLWPGVNAKDTRLGYPGLEKHVPEIKKLWKEKTQYRKFINRAVEYMRDKEYGR